jgi:hypothetical protein
MILDNITLLNNSRITVSIRKYDEKSFGIRSLSLSWRRTAFDFGYWALIIEFWMKDRIMKRILEKK